MRETNKKAEHLVLCPAVVVLSPGVAVVGARRADDAGTGRCQRLSAVERSVATTYSDCVPIRNFPPQMPKPELT